MPPHCSPVVILYSVGTAGNSGRIMLKEILKNTRDYTGHVLYGYFHRNVHRPPRYISVEPLEKYKELKAKLNGMAFYCRRLQGMTSHSGCINCDLSVTCSACDYEGVAVIGDLRTASLPEIYSSRLIHDFRRSLASGKLPIPLCAHCQHLALVPKENADYHVFNYPKLPNRGMMVENTVLCNLNCTSCIRSIVDKRSRKRMPLEDLREISSTIRDLKLQVIAYYSLGEPFLSRTITEELRTLREDNPDAFIYLSTNALLLDTEEKREAAMNLDYICISIHGYDEETVARYQIGGDFKRAYNNMRALAGYRNDRQLSRPVLQHKYLLFRWNDKEHQICRAIEVARDSGVDFITLDRTASPYHAVSYRLHFASYFQKYGQKKGYGRKVDFRENHQGDDFGIL